MTHFTHTHPPLHEVLDAYDCGAKARQHAAVASHHLHEVARIMRIARLIGNSGATVLRPEFTQLSADVHMREHMVWRTGFRKLVNSNRKAPGFMDGYRESTK
ncbi:MAG TPA: hypothetical protein VMV33_00215 [Rhodocyclaceae bacterium]|nr:hypothetical protein [Rhodocyclaceae bacterium]